MIDPPNCFQTMSMRTAMAPAHLASADSQQQQQQILTEEEAEDACVGSPREIRRSSLVTTRTASRTTARDFAGSKELSGRGLTSTRKGST